MNKIIYEHIVEFQSVHNEYMNRNNICSHDIMLSVILLRMRKEIEMGFPDFSDYTLSALRSITIFTASVYLPKDKNFWERLGRFTYGKELMDYSQKMKDRNIPPKLDINIIYKMISEGEYTYPTSMSKPSKFSKILSKLKTCILIWQN